MVVVEQAADPAFAGLWGWQQGVLQDTRVATFKFGSTVVVVPTGGGKCLGYATPVLMHDGSVAEVQDIRPGDTLMGPDSRPRRVLSTAVGYGPMYEVRPLSGEPWRCNGDHLLTLRRTRQRRADASRGPSDQEALIDISVNDLLAKSATFRHTHKLIRAAVEWPERHQPLDPYFLGLLLGDGDITRGRVSITTVDPEIVAECERQAKLSALNVRRDAHDGRTPTYHLTRGWSGGKPNPITEYLRELGLVGCTSHTKHIPQPYRVASRAQRLALLAGLMDTDGHLHSGGFDYVTASERLADDTAFVARSVGLRVSKAIKLVNGERYWRLGISGDCSTIPTRLPRKQAPQRRQIKDPLRTGFEIEPVGDDHYYGFEIDGDGRFLLGDTTITHNTVIAGGIARGAHAKGKRVLFVVHRIELVQQVLDTLAKVLPDVDVGVEARGYAPMPWAMMQVGLVTTLVNRDWVRPPDIVIFDEAHHIRAKTWERVAARWPLAVRIGLTGTPERLDGKGLGAHFASMVVGPSIPDLVEGDAEGRYLAPMRTLTLPHGLDLKQMRKNRSGEYRDDDQADQLTERVIVNAADAYMKYARGRRAIFFGIHRDHSRLVANELRHRGVAAEHVDGTDPMGRRKRIMTEFRTGGIEVVCNVDLISEGFDAPSCDVVIMGKRTASTTRFLQWAGRCARYRPGKVALVIDAMGSSHELGLPDDVREWSLEDGEVKPARSGDRQVRVCDDCQTAFHGRRCPQCNAEVALVEVAQVDVELTEATAAPKQRRGRRRDLWALTTAARGSADPRGALEAIAAERGFDAAWVGQIMRAWGMT